MAEELLGFSDATETVQKPRLAIEDAHSRPRVDLLAERFRFEEVGKRLQRAFQKDQAFDEDELRQNLKLDLVRRHALEGKVGSLDRLRRPAGGEQTTGLQNRVVRDRLPVLEPPEDLQRPDARRSAPARSWPRSVHSEQWMESSPPPCPGLPVP